MADEAVSVVDAEAGAEPASGEAPGAVQPDVTETPTGDDSATGSAPAWAPTQDDWQALQTELAQLRQAVAPAPAAAPEPQFTDYFQQDADGSLLIDPANLQKYIEDQVQGQLASVRPVLDQTIQERGEHLISQELEKLKETVGPFDAKLARTVAEGLVRETGDPMQALHQAAKLVHDSFASAGSSAVEEYKKTLANVGNAPTDPSAAGAALLDQPKPRSYGDAVNNWLSRNGFQGPDANTF